MKTKLLLFLILSFLFLPSSYSQSFGGGISLGVNASQVDGDALSGFNQLGLNLGAFVNYEISNGLYIQPELLLEQNGSSFQGITLLRTTYLSLPVIFKVNIPIQIGSSTEAIQLQAGPSVGLLLRGRNDGGGDISDVFKDTDIRILGGVGVRLSPGLTFLLRYGRSLASIVPTNAPGAAGFFAPGRTGLAHNYVNFALRLHFTAN
ncbi:MAG: outer membrane beta-barrel protein [Bacteroidota bacterium]